VNPPPYALRGQTRRSAVRQIIAIATALVLWAGCESAGSSQEPAGADSIGMLDDAGSTDAWIQEDSVTPLKADEAMGDVAIQRDETSSPDTISPVDYTGKWCSRLECELQPGAQGGWDCPPETNSMTPEGVQRICGDVK